MQVEITQKHIEIGLWKSYTDDACVLAIKDALKRDFLLDVEDVTISDADYVFINGWMFDLPEEIGEWNAQFDKKNVVKPISFELDIPDDFFQRKNNLPKRKL